MNGIEVHEKKSCVLLPEFRTARRHEFFCQDFFDRLADFGEKEGLSITQ